MDEENKRKLTFGRLNRHGRLANMLFFVASSYGLAKKSKRELALPKWKYQEYFEWSKEIEEIPVANLKEVVEPAFHYCGEYFDSVLNSNEELVNIAGYFQTERYFSLYTEEIRKILTFKKEFKRRVLWGMEGIFDKDVIAIHVRRGDYVGNENYYQLPVLYYILALEEYFPDWMENYNILVFSDDVRWCKTYLSGNNIYYSENRNDIEDMCLMSMCNHFILSNSSYSWWGAWLSNTKGIVVHPAHMFAGELYKTHDVSDFWISDWREFDHENKKIDLKDCSFLIPVFYDHHDREENLHRVIEFLYKNFNTNIVVGEQGSSKFQPICALYSCVYTDFTDVRTFHRTRMLNEMASNSGTDVVVNYDADIIIPVIQLLQAVKLLRKGTPVVFPYDGKFARIPKELQYSCLSELDISQLKGSRIIDPVSMGGCIMFRKESFIEIGMENENFISYGPEDTERVERINKLGIYIQRIKGTLYHYDHYIGENSSGKNPFFGWNNQELERIRKLSKEELEKEIETWEWRKNNLELLEKAVAL